MLLQLLCISVLITVCVSSQSCPASYARFSQTHSYCLPPNPECHAIKTGVSHQEIEEILRVHNDYRSKVATGQETQAGGLPEASNMLQMVWDDELAAIAQSWANQCEFSHDCNECRQVKAFAVGQNIAYRAFMCSNCDVAKLSEPDWTGRIKAFYDEVSYFSKDGIEKYAFGHNYGHFSQVVWAESWRIGCGYVVQTKGNKIQQLYVCNYGPGGNAVGASLYKEGKPCSECPVNSCCGNECPKDQVFYPGLCNLKPSSVPVYRKTDDSLLDCDVDESPDCEASVSGKWMKQSTVAGDYFTITIKDGEQGTLDFAKPFTPNGPFCLRIMFRKGSLVDGEPDLTELVLHVKTAQQSVNIPLKVSNKNFVPMSVDLNINSEIKVGVTFSVPDGAGDHILDIKRITAFDGKCQSRVVG